MKNKTVFLQKMCYYITLLLFVLSTIAGWFGISGDRTTVRLKSYLPQQEITGWGTSAAWWAQMVDSEETAEEYAKLLYSKEGLGLNVYRYNVGGGEAEHPEPRCYSDRSRMTESFLVADAYAATGELTYDWSKDANAQQMLFKSLEYGCIDTVVLFANSPHYLMTKSGHASGSFEDNTNNLKEECYEDFADYMLDIAEHFIGEGVPVKYISPINEPEWSWGGGWVGQEGCHYDFETVIEVARVFAQKIKERNLDVKLLMMESGQVSIDNPNHYAFDGIDALYADEEIASVLGPYAYHSYWTDGNVALKSTYGNYLELMYPDVEIDMSEWCELPNSHTIYDIEAATYMAKIIGEDITLSGASSWSSWVAVNIFGEDGESTDSMIGVDASNYDDYEIGSRYYAFAHYSKFIPVGSKVIDFDLSVADIKAEKAEWIQWINDKKYPVYLIENNLTVSAYETPEGDYVAVIVNESDEEKQINFSGLLLRDMKVYTTDADSNLELTAQQGNGIKKINIGADSITTVVFSK